MTASPRYVLRTATPDDEAFLLALYGSSRPDASLVQAWPPEQRDAFLRSQFDLQRHHYETHFPASEHSIILRDGIAVGRLWLDWRSDEVRMLDVALTADTRGQGLGSAILDDVKQWAKDRGVALTLNVEHNNPGALRFYERHGFRRLRDIGTHWFMEWTPDAAPSA